MPPALSISPLRGEKKGEIGGPTFIFPFPVRGPLWVPVGPLRGPTTVGGKPGERADERAWKGKGQEEIPVFSQVPSGGIRGESTGKS